MVTDELSQLPDPAPRESLRSVALDFVEQELGQFYAAENWQKLRQKGAAEKAVMAWLALHGVGDVSASQLSTELDTLFAEGLGVWPRGFYF